MILKDFLMIFISCVAITTNAQSLVVSRYLPEDLAPRKKLTLYINKFEFTDYSANSCWLWYSVSGEWKLKSDTLALYWMSETSPFHIEKITYYRIFLDRLYYIDCTDENIFTNWGTMAIESSKRLRAKDKFGIGRLIKHENPLPIQLP